MTVRNSSKRRLGSTSPRLAPRLALALALTFATVIAANVGTTKSVAASSTPWQLLHNAAPGNPGAMLLLTNGQVLVEDQGPSNSGSPNWWLLTPDASGSYVNGTWSNAGSLPAPYSPQYFASAVLPNGKVIVEGGEFNGTSTFAGSDLGAIYDPVSNTWTAVQPPNGGAGCWSTIADAPATVLANGSFLLGASGSRTDRCQALYQGATSTWTSTGTGKFDPNAEEGFTLLPNNQVLTVDTGTTVNGLGGVSGTELYNPTTGAWTSAGSTPAPLDNLNAEMGPQMLMPNGNVFAEGATGQNALYNSTTGTWSAAPSFPVINGQQVTASDSCSAILPNGDVLFNGSPNQKAPTSWFIYDGTSITQIANDVAMNASSETSNLCNALVLPTGQVMVDVRYGPTSIEVYNPGVASNPAWAPEVTSVPSSLSVGTSYTVSGNQLNGLTLGSAFGDDLENSTNYPLVQVTNDQTHHVVFARSSGFTSMSVTPGLASSAQFVLPPNAQDGPSQLRVIASGFASTPWAVSVSGGVAVPVVYHAPKRPKATRTVITCQRGRTNRIVRGVDPRCPAGYHKITVPVVYHAPKRPKATRTVITCQRGRTNRIVRGVDPRCPAGYHKIR